MNSARGLTTRLAELLRSERASLGEFLVTLADLDRQRGWVELGYASLFNYLHQELELSKGAAFQRMTAAQLIQKYPEVVELLRDGRLCLSTLTEVSKVITPENRGEVLARYAHLSKREAMAVTAELKPCEVVPQRVLVTAVRAPTVASSLPLPASRTEPPVHPGELTSSSIATLLPEPPPRTEAVPLTAELSRMHVTVSRRFLEKLEAARAALSHSHPGASEEELLEAGLDLLLERHAKRRGLVSRPRQEPRPAQPEHVPAHVKRAEWNRDGGKCQWPLQGGGVCGSTHQVEIDHIVPRALGGPSTVENTRLTCRFHNHLAARQVYGDAWMDRYTRGGATPSPGEATLPP